MDGEDDTIPSYEDAPVKWAPKEEWDIGDGVPEPERTPEEQAELEAVAEDRQMLDDVYRSEHGLPPSPA